MKWLAVVGVVAGCGTVRTDPPPTTNAQLTTPFDRELGRMQELDYRSPMRPRWTSDELSERREILKTTCESGTPLACRRVYRPGTTRGDIAMYCRAGDQLSCRWDTWWNNLNASPGNADDVPYPFTLPESELRRGCAEGLHAECVLLLRTNDVANVRHGAENNCRFAKRDCLVGAESYLSVEPREPMRARYLAELDCQRDDLNSCLWLSLAYRSGSLVEPVVGRGDELHNYVCQHRHSQFCAEIDTKCNARRDALLAHGACETQRSAPIRR
jgi:hypothetical protein